MKARTTFRVRLSLPVLGALSQVIVRGVPAVALIGVIIPTLARARDYIVGVPVRDSLALLTIIGVHQWGVAFAIAAGIGLVGQALALFWHRYLLTAIGHALGALVYVVYAGTVVAGSIDQGWSTGWRSASSPFAAFAVNLFLAAFYAAWWAGKLTEQQQHSPVLAAVASATQEMKHDREAQP